MGQNEKRASARWTIRDDVTLVVAGNADKERCILENVSMGGAKFFSSLKLAVGRLVELRVPSQEDEPEIIIKAKILRSGPGEYSKSYGYACIIKDTVNA